VRSYSLARETDGWTDLLVTLSRHFEFVGSNEEDSDERHEVSGDSVVHDKVLAHADGRLLQKTLVGTTTPSHKKVQSRATGLIRSNFVLLRDVCLQA